MIKILFDTITSPQFFIAVLAIGGGLLVVGFMLGTHHYKRRWQAIQTEHQDLRASLRDFLELPATITLLNEDVASRLKQRLEQKHEAAALAVKGEQQPLLSVIAWLRELGPAEYAFAEMDQPVANEIHQRFIEILETICSHPDKMMRLFHEGELTRFFQLSGRLDSFFASEPYTAAVKLVTAYLSAELTKQGLIIIVPKALTIADPQEADLVYEDHLHLRTLDPIRSRLAAVRTLMPNTEIDNHLVIECIKPGYIMDGRQTLPRLLVSSKGW